MKTKIFFIRLNKWFQPNDPTQSNLFPTDRVALDIRAILNCWVEISQPMEFMLGWKITANLAQPDLIHAHKQNSVNIMN